MTDSTPGLTSISFSVDVAFAIRACPATPQPLLIVFRFAKLRQRRFAIRAYLCGLQQSQDEDGQPASDSSNDSTNDCRGHGFSKQLGMTTSERYEHCTKASRLEQRCEILLAKPCYAILHWRNREFENQHGQECAQKNVGDGGIDQ